MVAFGGHVVHDDDVDWYESRGIAFLHRGEDAILIPTKSYLSSTLPSIDLKELVRKTAIRDPRYRLYLDLLLCRVVVAIGAGNRWERLQELLEKKLHPLAPRLLGLARWMSYRTGKPILELSEHDWDRVEEEVQGDDRKAFAEWNEILWGSGRNAAELFPLLEELYVPLVAQPVHFRATDGACLLAQMVSAARQGDGIQISQEESQRIEEWQIQGAPIDFDREARIGWLTLATELSSEDQFDLDGAPSRPSPLTIAKVASSSDLLVPGEQTDYVQTESNGPARVTATFLSVLPDKQIWPEKPLSNVPCWSALPASEEFRKVSVSRAKSPEVDSAFEFVAEHPVHGLLLQVFLAETLDREMGEESIILAPPLDRKVECIEGETEFLYRPSQLEGLASDDTAAGFLSLGEFDDIMTHLGNAAGLLPVPLPFPAPCPGVWSSALRLFISLELVVGQQDRWTLRGAVMDRLYGGALMRDIIRGRKEFREDLHHHLSALWHEKNPGRVLGREVAV
ncbi:MAG: hypothetical protein MI807_17910 [Verrucomicrobiales bacterium]|nr:hypothetical protein [Verrucomicrobiales bacterium]